MVRQDWESGPAGRLVGSENVCQRLRGQTVEHGACQSVAFPGSQIIDSAACPIHSASHCRREQGVKSQLAMCLWISLSPPIMSPQELASGFSMFCSAVGVPCGRGVAEGGGSVKSWDKSGPMGASLNKAELNPGVSGRLDMCLSREVMGQEFWEGSRGLFIPHGLL